MWKDKQESFTIRWHFRKLCFNCTLEKEWSQARVECVPVVQSRADGGLKHGLAAAPRERSSLSAAHTPAHDKLEQREVEALRGQTV